jgi:hypothetical protein
VVGRIQNILERRGLTWKVGRTGTLNSRVRPVDCGPCPEDDPWVAIENSRQGDVHVIDHLGRRRVSFEVKASLEWPNAAISESELQNSEAEYLVGITTAGLWVCHMDEARRKATKMCTSEGSFWIVPYDMVRKVELSDILPF